MGEGLRGSLGAVLVQGGRLPGSLLSRRGKREGLPRSLGTMFVGGINQPGFGVDDESPSEVVLAFEEERAVSEVLRLDAAAGVESREAGMDLGSDTR